MIVAIYSMKLAVKKVNLKVLRILCICHFTWKRGRVLNDNVYNVNFFKYFACAILL